jgi:Dolichyl-phosphate-mannose-protein mannosyltransferase
LAGSATAVGTPARSVVRAVPVWAWLGGLVALSFAVRFALARRIAAPWIMVDEIVYSELAKGFAETGRFAVRGEPTGAYGIVYPLLISPAYALFESLPQAYEAVRAINALLMSLAAVPAYLLARRVLPVGLSLLASAMAVALPSLLYTGEVMTENAFYVIFLCVALALVLCLERPTVTRQLVLLVLCGVAYLTRQQALAFLPAAAAAPFLLKPRELRRFAVLYGALGFGLAALLLAQVVRGRSPLDLLGSYAVAGEHSYEPLEVGRWLLYHLAELDLYLGVAPFAAVLMLAALLPRLPRATRPFLAATFSLSFFLVLEVSAFATLPAVERIEERNLFYLAPLAVIALLLWIDLGLPRPLGATGVVAAIVAALPGVIPYERLIGVPSQSDTLALLALWRAHERWFGLDDLATVTVLAAIAATLVFVLVPRRFALALPLLVLAFFLVVQRPIEARLRYAAAGARAEGIMNPQRDWVDRAVSGRGEVAVLWTGNTSEFVVWENEFFSRSIGPVYDLGDPMGGGLPSTEATVDASTGVVRGPDGRPVEAEFALSDGSVTPAGEQIAADPKRGVFLYEVDPPLRSTTRVTGLHPNDTWSTGHVTYERLACAGGALTLLLHSDPHVFQRPQTVTARIGGDVAARWTLVPRVRGQERTVRLRPDRGVCRVDFTVSPTAVPGHGDLRRLGIHFSAFRYRPPARPLAAAPAEPPRPLLVGAAESAP